MKKYYYFLSFTGRNPNGMIMHGTTEAWLNSPIQVIEQVLGLATAIGMRQDYKQYKFNIQIQDYKLLRVETPENAKEFKALADGAREAKYNLINDTSTFHIVRDSNRN